MIRTLFDKKKRSACDDTNANDCTRVSKSQESIPIPIKVLRNVPELNAHCYVAGYIVKRLDIHCKQCSICSNGELIDSDPSEDREDVVFTYLKSLGEGNFGGLTVPSSNIVLLAAECDAVFTSHFQDCLCHPLFETKIVTSSFILESH